MIGNNIGAPVGGSERHRSLISAGSGSYVLTGPSAGLISRRKLDAVTGSYALVGQGASLRHARKITAGAGVYAVTGIVATTLFDRRLAANAGSYAIVGKIAGLLEERRLVADAGSYTLAGAAAGLYRGYPLRADAGAYGVTGAGAYLRWTHRLPVSPGVYVLNQSPTESVPLIGTSIGGVIAVPGPGSAGLLVGRKLYADVGAYALIGLASEPIYTYGTGRSIDSLPPLVQIRTRTGYYDEMRALAEQRAIEAEHAARMADDEDAIIALLLAA